MPATREDDSLARVLLSGKHLGEPELEKARKLQREKHADLDLAQVLLRYRLIDKSKIVLAQKLAKMTRGDSGPLPPPGTAPKASPEKQEKPEKPAKLDKVQRPAPTPLPPPPTAAR